LVLSCPLADIWKSGEDVKENQALLRQAELGERQLQEAIELEVKQALWHLTTAAEAIAAEQENVAQAREVLELAEIRYRNGSITNLEYLDAQLALSRARTAYVRALYDHNLSRIQLAYALGENYHTEE
jgi:outer membrane protein TolC